MSERSHSKYKACSDDLLSILSDNLKRLRCERGWSQEELAEEAEMHRTFISLIERKGRNVTLGVLEALANALDVDVSVLVTKHHD